MKSRLLPACRTDALVLRATRRTELDDHVLCDTPDCRATWYGHRLVLDDPPDDPERWFARWDEAHAGKDIGRAYLVWEHRLPKPIAIPTGCELVQHRVMMHDEWEEPVTPTEALRPLLETDAEALLQLMIAENGDDAELVAYERWYLEQLFAHRAEEQAVLWGAFVDGALVGTTSVVWDRREARLQNVLVDATHRQKGLATALVQAAVGSYRDQSMGIVYLVTVLDGMPEKLYRKVGFRHVSYFWELARP
ncbi:MAG: GNAT family N-acetyltransferase [Proteobacteria bacterium]|nr:GNAT family N-acetyltransferase [Pseudomonadota bacterium]